MADPGEDLGPVLLDRLARAAAVAALAPGEVDRELVRGQGEAGRDALDRDAERLAVRFARGQEAERGPSPLRRLAGRAAEPSAGRGRGGRRRAAHRPPARPRPTRSPPARAPSSARLHQVERRRLPGPQRERGRALVEQHQLAVGDASQPAAAASRRSRVRRVDQVEDEQVRPWRISAGIGETSPCSPIDVALTRTRVLASSDSMIDSCQGIARSSMWAALRPKCLTSALGPVEVAVEHDDPLEALGDEAVDDRAARRRRHRARPPGAASSGGRRAGRARP